MSKLQVEVVSYINNIVLTVVSFHVILSTWVDRTPTSFAYFYIICACLIFNFIGALLPVRSSK